MKTDRILISNIKPGMVLAEDVHNSVDQLVLNEGTELNEHSITRLKFYNIHEVLVAIPDSAQEETAASKNESYTETVKKSPEFKAFKKEYDVSLSSIEDRMRAFVQNPDQELDTEPMLNNVSEIFGTVNTCGQVFDMLMCIRNLDDLTFVHGLNVGIICNVFAQWLKYSPEDTQILVTAGLLHDIGKLTIPDKILTKKGALTEEEYNVIKGHSRAGYNMLKNQNLDPRIALAALQHHERSDGTGYPDGLKAPHISEFAKIIAIADVYDAMTAARCYRGPICPLEVLNTFENDGLSKYDPKFLLSFMDKVVSTYTNHHVLLNNGKVGEIVMVNKHSPARPILRMMNGECIDLSKESGLAIVGIV